MASPPPVGLLYDERMCRHDTPDGDPHPECPDRIRAIWKLLESSGISQRCQLLTSSPADEDRITLVHTRAHVNLVKEIGSDGFDPRRRNRVASRFNSIYLNDGSSESAFLAAGGVLEVARKVAEGKLRSGIAIVRPPGHHAEPGEMMGFCIFNNVAVAASYLLNARPELGIKKILIVDWDVHHGNGTQKMFYNDPRVLFFSVHRKGVYCSVVIQVPEDKVYTRRKGVYCSVVIQVPEDKVYTRRFDYGSFYPAGGDGSHVMIGEGLGTGYNINVPWEHGQCGDADYIAVWDHILIPVAKAYNPDIILVSAGFDAAIGDPLGGCCISPYGYSVLLYKLTGLAQGKIILVLEGGYNLNSVARSVLECAEVLLGKKPLIGPLLDQPFESSFRVIKDVCSELNTYWPVLAVEFDESVFSSARKAYPMVSRSSSDSENDEGGTSLDVPQPDMELNVVNVENSFSTLSLCEVTGEQESSSYHFSTKGSQCFRSNELPTPDQIVNFSISWRSLLSKTYIWYGSYGSNMWTPRFLCYIKGGQAEGMKRPCSGSNDKSLPKDIIWRTMPYRLFFGWSHTETWGAGGVAFLHPEISTSDKAFLCLYKITLEQFNDILSQENCLKQEMSVPLVDLLVLNVLSEKKAFHLSSLLEKWYSNVLYLGDQDDIPILTMTCPNTHLEGFLSGKFPTMSPSKEYKDTLVRGLVEGNQLSKEEAVDYINRARLSRS